jgi:hypothetical protein
MVEGNSFVYQLLTDSQMTSAVDVLVDTTPAHLMKRAKILSDILNLTLYDNTQYIRAVLTKTEVPVASILATGQEFPSSQTGSMINMNTKIPKIGASLVFTEEDMEQMREIYNQANTQRINVINQSPGDPFGLQGGFGSGSTGLAAKLYGDTVQLIKSVVDGVLVQAWHTVCTCEVNLNINPLTREKTGFSYRRKGVDYNFYPDPLTATGVTGNNAHTNKWDDYANAQGLDNIHDLATQMWYETGHYPDYLIMSRKLVNHLRKQQSVKDSVAIQARAFGNTGIVSDEMLTKVIDDKFGVKGPELHIVDDMYQTQDVFGRVKNARFIPDHLFVLASNHTKTNAQLAIGAMLENSSRMTSYQDGIPVTKAGLYHRIIEDNKKSPLVCVQEAGIKALTVIPDDRYFGAQQVLDPE